MSFFDNDINDRDAPQPADLADDDEGDDDDAVTCGICGQVVHRLAPRCPSCGQWLFDDTPAARRSRGWFWPVMVALLIAVILVIWRRLGRN